MSFKSIILTLHQISNSLSGIIISSRIRPPVRRRWNQCCLFSFIIHLIYDELGKYVRKWRVYRFLNAKY